MTLAKFSVFDITIKLFKFESKTGQPVYAIKTYRGFQRNYTYVHNSISYTHEQAFQIFRDMVIHLNYRYIHLQANKHILILNK